jgi:two-component system OmpR family response regulator
VLLSHPGQVLSRDQLMSFAKGRESEPFERTIDLRVSRLRQRLGDDGGEPRIIKTVRGQGYVLAAPVTMER